MKNKFYQAGYGLIEILIALSVLLIATTSLIPAFVLSAETSKRNETRTIAYNIAQEEIEKIKNLPYDDVGLINGNPPGVLEPDVDKKVAGLPVHIKIRIRWVDDESDDVAPADSDPRDYKKVTVWVTWQTLLQKNTLSLSTIISRQSKEQIALGGNILVTVKRLNGDPIEDAKVEITTGPSAPITDWSDEKGECFFPMLKESESEGDYTVTVSKPGLIAQSNLSTQTTTVKNGEIRYLEFIMEPPGQLIVKLVDPLGEIIEKPSKIKLVHPDAGTLNFNEKRGYFVINDIFPGTWEIYPHAASYESPEEPTIVTITSLYTTEIEITLKPKPQGELHLEVYDNATKEPVPNAKVVITNLQTQDSIEAETNVQGILETQLEVGEYQLEITKTGYLTFIQSFTIKESGNTFLTIYLNKAEKYGAILVRTEYVDGSPRNNVWVRVLGNRYRKILKTGTYAPGEALFNNLKPGTYLVYKWKWGWRNLRVVIVEAGQQTKVIYTYTR
jgi:hypothetical protein